MLTSRSPSNPGKESGMLCLTVRANGKLYIGDIILVNRDNKPVKVAIEAPKKVRILRGEVKEREAA